MRKTKNLNEKKLREGTNDCNQKGITLIALVITIIVMLILVAVTITMAVNGGLFEYAQRAGTQTNAAVEAEQEFANLEANMTVDELIDKYTGGSGAGGELPAYSDDLLDNATKVLKTNAKYTDGNNKEAIIPQGFKLLLEVEDEIDKGIVIQDATGNEFVWIPVIYKKAGDENEAEKKLDSNFLNVFKRSNADDESYSEPYESGYSDKNGIEEAKDYYDMMKSVQDNYGFYIGRYEAGTTEERKFDFDNGTDTLIVKRDAIPYTHVAWGKDRSDYKSIIKYDSNSIWYSETGKNQGNGALLLSKELYGKTEDVGKYGVVSTLCYGVQWDAMLRFMEKDTEANSTGWGNYANNSLKITRASAKYYSNNQWDSVAETEISCGQLMTTGAHDSFAVKNIYDIAGNCFEWTMEVYYSSCVMRGGCYSSVGGGWSPDNNISPASCRGTYMPLQRRTHFIQTRTLYKK